MNCYLAADKDYLLKIFLAVSLLIPTREIIQVLEEIICFIFPTMGMKILNIA